MEEEGEEEAGDEPMPFQNMVDPDFADRMGASPSVTEVRRQSAILHPETFDQRRQIGQGRGIAERL